MSDYKDNEEITDAFEDGDKEKFKQLVKSYHKMFSAAESALSDILYQLDNE